VNAPRSDALYLDHIHERIEERADEGREAFESSHILQDAVIRNVEVIGEVVKQICSELQDRYSDVVRPGCARFM